MPTPLSQHNFRVNSDHFALVPKSSVPRATFERIFEHKLTGDSGYLIPIHVDEVLPGDVHTGQITVFARLSTLLFPLMDNAQIDIHAFFIPARILWTNWQKFQGQQDNPGDSISYTIPTLPYTGINNVFANLSYALADYMGIPVSNFPGGTINVNALPLRAYNKVFNEWYRDQNLQNSVPNNTGDGPDNYANYTLLRRNKRHDYFTSALPWPQKGNPVSVPFGTAAPIRGIGIIPTAGTAQGPTDVRDTGYGQIPPGGTTPRPLQTYPYYTSQLDVASNAGFVISTSGPNQPTPNIYADLTEATAVTINALRLAIQTQKLLETDARGGTRYTETLRARWGITPQDARLQRPEYIGGGTISIQTAAIAQTSQTGAALETPAKATPLGGLAGQATASGGAHFTCIGHEHGYMLILASLMSRQTYQQGLHRMWTRQTRYDFAMPEFVGLGEQAIRNDEIYATGLGPGSTDTLTFGYQERYAEYRYTPSRISGLFTSTTTLNIDEWHLAQQFSTLPTLSATFVQENAPFNRVLAAGSDANGMQFLADCLFTIKSTRPLPAFGIPASLTHL